MYYVYILQSIKDQSFYIGYSKDPKARLEKHNRPHKGYTARKQPWEIFFIEQYQTKEEALQRERFIKKQKSKQFILNLKKESSE
jgi:putative endonuclease